MGGQRVRHVPLAAKLAMVADIPREDVESLIAICDDEHTVPAKRDIISEGDRPDHVHVIIEGWAARYKTLQDGSRQIVAFLLPGDFCDPHVAILGHMDHGIVAVTRCRIAYIPSARLDALISSNWRVAKALWWATLVDEGILREWILNIGRRNALARVAHLLCELHARMQMIGLVDSNDRLAMPLTQEQIADAMGLTSVHTNRTLQRLRAQMLVEIESGYLTLLDVEGLKEVAGFTGNYLHVKRRSVTA